MLTLWDNKISTIHVMSMGDKISTIHVKSMGDKISTIHVMSMGCEKTKSEDKHHPC